MIVSRLLFGDLHATILKRSTVKFHRLVMLCLFPSFISTAFSQYDGSYPFNTPVDPRSAAMGESFVALPSDPAALMYNPAGLAGLNGLSVSYSRMSMDWFIQDWSVASVTAAAGTPFGVIAAQYNRKSMGKVAVTTVQYPGGTGSEISLYSYSLALGYSYRLPVGLALGISAKYYDYLQTVSGPAPVGLPPWHTVPSYLFDFGLTYTLPRLHSQSTVEDSLTIGMCYQNIGTRWQVSIPLNTFDNSGATTTEYLVLPQYYRLGLSYAMRLRPTEEGGLSPFGATIAGEFRSLQSPLPTSYAVYSYSAPYPETSYWGLGLEFTFYDIVSVRGGAAFRPYSDVEADRDRASFRYGACVCLPFRRIGIDLPLTFSFQYTVIPVSEPVTQYVFDQPAGPGFFEDMGARTGTYPLLSLEIQYEGVPW